MDPRASVMGCMAPLLLRSGRRVPCRHCDRCLERDARELFARSDAEFLTMRAGTHAVMGSLTFDSKALPGALPDWGRAAWRACEVSLCQAVPGLKFFAVPEFGELHGRLHVHFVAWGVPQALCRSWTFLENGHGVVMFGFRELVRQAWPHGFERCDVARSQGAGRYVMKYVTKGRADHLRSLAQWKALGVKLQAQGVELPAFVKRWWTAWPRGRQGGLGRAFAVELAKACEVHPLVRAGVDLPPFMRVGGKRRAIPRYVRRFAQRELALDSPRAKSLREAMNPESVEMAARIAAAGSVDALRRCGGHIDDDVAMSANAKARKARELGRW